MGICNFIKEFIENRRAKKRLIKAGYKHLFK